MESYVSFYYRPLNVVSAEISNRVSRKMRLRRATSIAGENSINFELNFQILSDDRGPGPLSSDEIWEFNSVY